MRADILTILFKGIRSSVMQDVDHTSLEMYLLTEPTLTLTSLSAHAHRYVRPGKNGNDLRLYYVGGSGDNAAS